MLKKLIGSIAFENATAECKKFLRPLRDRSQLLYEWIKTSVNIESNAHNSAMIKQLQEI